MAKKRSGSKRKRGKGSGKTTPKAAGGAAAASAAPVTPVVDVPAAVVDVAAPSEAPAAAPQVVAEPSPAPAPAATAAAAADVPKGKAKEEEAAPVAPAASDAAPVENKKGNQNQNDPSSGKKKGPKPGKDGKAKGKKGGGGGVTDLWKAKDEKVMPWLDHRLSMFEELYKNQTEEYKQKQRPITVELPDGTQVQATAFVDTPGNLLKAWNTELLKTAVISKVAPLASKPVAFEDGEDGCWDLMRPLEFDCVIAYYTFDSAAGRHTFWHSSAHILGQSLERIYGGRLTTGPALEDSFYYDADTENTISSVDFKDIEAMAKRIGKEKQPFQRLVVSKDAALSMFKYNPFKVKIVEKNIPDGGVASVYRCGPLIDLCTGPHLPNTQLVKSFVVTKNSSAYFQNSADNPSLQRVYGVSFPDKARLDLWAERMRLAQENDHRLVGQRQELYFFHDLSPGSCFWLPHGARLYNKLLAHMREQYWKRGYSEVISPNIYNFKLWETSGHAAKYAENMFQFEVEKAKFAMKPMNCPGHCLMFQHVPMTYKKLPLRMADFGVLHRNELSGALSGLTRVRRFQQDDAHIFCRMDQVSDEVRGCLEFMRDTYAIFGFAYKLKLSTRPETFMGAPEDWDTAEEALKIALQAFAGDDWTVNPGDGAFYGPKIDIEVFDALERGFQCATVQLDFQLPKNFDLKYKTESGGFERPVMVHRAILGSVERFVAILAEHCGGKWPFWVAPRQVIVLPITTDCTPYANLVAQKLHDAGYYVDVDESNRRIPKMILEAGGKYNFIAVVGRSEVEQGTVNMRARGEGRSQQGVQLGNISVDSLIEYFNVIRDNKTKEGEVLAAFAPFSAEEMGIGGQLVLKCNADDHRALASRAAAVLGKASLEFQETFDCSFELQTKEGVFTSPAAVLRLLVSAGKPSADLVGGPTPMGAALVDQWVDVAFGDLCAAVDPIVFPLRGWAEFNKDAYEHAFSALLRQLAQLNTHLASRTFLASERLSIGDIAVASVLLPVFQHVLSPAMRNGSAMANVTRWLSTVIHVPEFQAVCGPIEFCDKPIPAGSKIVS